MYVCMYESQGEVSMSSRVMAMVVVVVVVMVRARIELEDFQVTVVGIGMIGRRCLCMFRYACTNIHASNPCICTVPRP